MNIMTECMMPAAFCAAMLLLLCRGAKKGERTLELTDRLSLYAAEIGFLLGAALQVSLVNYIAAALYLADLALAAFLGWQSWRKRGANHE